MVLKRVAVGTQRHAGILTDQVQDAVEARGGGVMGCGGVVDVVEARGESNCQASKVHDDRCSR